MITLLLGILVIGVLVSFVVSKTSGDEVYGYAQERVVFLSGGEVEKTQSLEVIEDKQITRGPNWDDVVNVDGSHTRSYYAGKVNYLNNDEYEPINTTILSSEYLNYEYEMTKNDFKAYFESNINTGEAVRYEKDGYYFTYDLGGGKMQWVEQEGDPTKTKAIGAISSSTAITDDNKIYYNNAFSYTNISYEILNNMLKEYFILSQMPKDEPYLYLEYTGEIKYSNDLTIFANGGDKENKDFQTTGSIEFRDLKNNTMFFLPEPTAWDSNGTYGEAYYNVKVSDEKIQFGLRVNKTFLEDAVYPVYIDPTIMYNYTDTTNNKAYEYEDDSYNPIAADSTGDGEISSYTNLLINDGTTKDIVASYFWDDNIAQHNFHFTINQDISDITQIDVLYSGKYSATSCTNEYNAIEIKTDSSYENFGTLTTSDADYTKEITSDFADYLDGNNKLYIRAYKSCSPADDVTLYSDYVSISVTYTPKDIIINNTAFNDTEINTDEKIRLNVSVTTDGTLDKVWAEMLYPNGTLKNNTMIPLTYKGCANVGSCDACGNETNCTDCSEAGCNWTSGGGSYAISFTGFEADHTTPPYDGWSDGGADCIPGEEITDYCSDSTCPGAGTYSLQIEDDTSSSISTYTLDTTTACDGEQCDEIIFSGWAYPNSYDSTSEGFSLMCDYGGATETVIADWLDDTGKRDICGYTISENSWGYFECNLSAIGCTLDSDLEISLIGGQRTPASQGGGDQTYYDGLNLTGVKSGNVCSGDLDCSVYTNETGCNNCGQCNWTDIPIGTGNYTLIFNETSQTGQYNISKIFANTTDGTLNWTDYSDNYWLNFTVLAGDSCDTNNWDCTENCDVEAFDAGGDTIYATGDGVITIKGDVTNCNYGGDMLVVSGGCEVVNSGGYQIC